MCEIRTVYVVLLVSLSLSWQHACAEDEYEYYYEEVNATTTVASTTNVETSTFTITGVPQKMNASVTTPIATPVPIVWTVEETAEPNVTDDSLNLSFPITPEVVPISTTDVRITDKTPNIVGNKRNITFMVNTTPKPKDFGRPEIVMNIFTGMYGMHKQGNKRGSKYQGGRNKYWPREQSSLQGWYNLYGMNNRTPFQMHAPRQRNPVYRGRAPINQYDDSYDYSYPTAKPKRNNKQQKPSTLEQQASMAVFNFLLQALGQRSASSRSQPQTQRRRT